MNSYYILMADIISSASYEGKKLMRSFKHLVDTVNKEEHLRILSPFTITLGDEFQGVCRSQKDAIQCIIALEEKRLYLNLDFKLRYVLHYGVIETPLNREIAYGMVGKGLTDTRNYLEELKKSKENRFAFHLANQLKSEALDNAFKVYQSFVDDWSSKDTILVNKFMEGKDYKQIANELHKDRSLIWRREHSLKWKEYQCIRSLILYLCHD